LGHGQKECLSGKTRRRQSLSKKKSPICGTLFLFVTLLIY
jgi:hypothetical protein